MAGYDYDEAFARAEDAAYALNPRGIGSDVKTALKQGLLNLPSAATGLLDIPAGLLGANRPFSTAATKLGELTGIEPAKWAKILDQDYSRATKEGKREIQQVWDDPATSGWDVAKAYASNPRVTGLSAVESLPSMAAGWGVGGVAGKLGGIASASARAAVGEGSVMAGQGMSNISPDVDPQKAALAALAIGAGGAAISGGSANLLGRLGVRDIDTLATGGAQRLASEGVPPMPMYKRVPVGMVQEGPVEEGSQSALETGVQNIAEDKPLTQGMARNVIEGTLAGTPLGAIGGALPPAQAKPLLATPEDIANRVDSNKTVLEDISDKNKLALEAGKRWQDMVKEKGITAPEDDLATQRSIGLMAQAAADQKQIDEERAGAAAGKARDARLADVGQQFQALNIPDPANELAAQRVGMRPTPTESPYAVAPGRDIFNFPAAPEPVAEPTTPDASKTLDEAQRVLFGPRGGVAAEAVPPKAPTFASMQDAYMSVLPKLLEQAVAGNHITPAEAAWHAEDFAQAQNKKQFEAAKAKFEEALNGTRQNTAVLPPDNAPAVSGAPDVVGGMGSGDGIGFLTSAAQGDVPARDVAPAAGNAGEVSSDAVTPSTVVDITQLLDAKLKDRTTDTAVRQEIESQLARVVELGNQNRVTEGDLAQLDVLTQTSPDGYSASYGLHQLLKTIEKRPSEDIQTLNPLVEPPNQVAANDQIPSTVTKEIVNEEANQTNADAPNEGQNADEGQGQETLLKPAAPDYKIVRAVKETDQGQEITAGWDILNGKDQVERFRTKKEAQAALAELQNPPQAEALTKDAVLDDNQYVYHAVRNDEDIADISKNGLRPGTNLSDSKGQAFEGEGDTVLVFKKADVAVENKGYQNDLVATNEGAKPVAILKDTSVDVGGFTQNEWDAEAARIEAEAARIEAAQQAIADKYSVSLDDVIREGLRKKAEVVSPEDHKVLRKLDKQSDVMGEDMDRLAAQDGVAPTTEQDVLNRYTQHGVPVFAHTPTISEDTQNADEPISTTQTDAAVQPSKKEQTSVTEANQTEQGQSEKAASETVSADLKRWDEKLGNRLTASVIVSADPSVKTRETVPTEVNDVKSAIQAVLSLDPLDRTNRDELKLNLNYLAGVAADNKHTFGSSQDLQHIPEVVNDFLDEQEDLAVADGSPLQRMIGRARDRAKTSLAYVINNNEEIKKTDAQKSAELTKAANAVDAGQTLETEFDPSAPFDYGPEVTKELAIKDDAIEVLQRRSDAEPDNTKLAAGLVNARQQRNEYARKEQRRIESDRKASPATTAAGEEITPDMEAEIAARKEATLERQARRLEMGTKGVDIATSNMKPGHLTSLLEHYGIDVSKGVTPEARKTLQTNLRRDVAAYLKDGPDAVPVGIRGAIKAATEDKKGEVRYSKAAQGPVRFTEASFRNKTTGEIVGTGPVHNRYKLPGGWESDLSVWEPGFTDSEEKFYTRQEAAEVVDIPTSKDGLRTEDFSLTKGLTAAERSTAAEVEADLKDFMKSGSLGRNVTVVQDAGALPAGVAKSVSVDDTTQAFVHNGHAYVIAGNIAKGNARAVFLHDVGGHLGLENMLTKNQHRMLVDMVKAWAAREDGSQEHRFAKAALERVASAQTEDSQIGNETLTYFIEEAVQGGVNPTADNFKTELGRWFRVLWAAFKGAIRKLGMNPDKMTAQDIVDMAYGAARMEVHGTWHGTAADFRKFNHDYMGSGEGAQVKGWGSYLAQRAGIGKVYWTADVNRKTRATEDDVVANGGSVLGSTRLSNSLARLGIVEHTGNGVKLDFNWKANLASARALVARKKESPEGVEYLKTAEKFFAEYGEDLKNQTFTGSSPEGNLMRTDVNVADNEWLDLDKPLSTQPDILAKVMRSMPEFLQEAIVEEANQDIAEMDGETLYKALEFVESRDSLVSELFPVDEYNKTLANAQSKQVVSTYLDSIGIKGNKFLDSTSRGKDKVIAVAGKTYTRDDLVRIYKDEPNNALHRVIPALRSALRNGVDSVIAELEQKVAQHHIDGERIHRETSDRYKIPYTEASAKDRGAQYAENTYEYGQLQWLKENKPVVQTETQQTTHNFVVFNDKNIQRVASLKGADREKVQFSKAIPADRVEMAQKYGGKSGVQVVADTSYTVRKIADWITPLPDLIRKYGVEGKLPTVKEWYAAVQAKEEERNRIKQKAEVIAKIIEPLSDTQRGLLNELGYDSTFQQKWGYDPELKRVNKKWEKDAKGDYIKEAVKVTVDPEMKARFDKMEKDHPEVVKALKQMFAYGEEVRQDLRSVLRASGLSDSFIVANQLEGPYMPLRRFGNFAVVLKSDKLIAAEKAAEGTTPSSAASKLVDKLKMNADDFAFSRFETAGQAAVFLREQLSTGKFNKDKKFSNTFPYGDELNTMTTIPQDVLQRVMAHIKADENMDSAAKKSMVENVKDIYRQTTEDRLARQAQQRRKYRHGADTDMIRSFMAQSEADAGFLSLLKHGGTINDAIYQVQREGEENRQDLKAISDLIIAHHTEIQKVENTPIQDRLVALTSAMQLASSPSYHLSNMSQVFMVTMPKLAAVFNDYGGSYKAIMEGYKLYREITGGNIITGKTLDLESMKPGPLKDVLLHAVRRNLLDVGMDGDISQFNKFQTGYAVADGTSAVASKALYKLRQVSRGVELMNRIATVAASYNMYMERHKGEANAVANAQAFALEMTETTQGDMSNVAAPLALKLTPKVIGQYRKYQIMMVMFYADGFNKAFQKGNTKEDAAIRAIGRRMLAYKMFHTGMAAGVLGLPMINIVGPLFAALFGDDDEPKDFERMMRDTIGNQALADLLLHGPLQMMGLDTSAKLGDEKVFSIMPFTDFDISSKKGLALTTMGLIGGPAFGQASKMADGVGLMQQGAYYKGIEKMLPKGLEDAFKGFRLANEGYTLKNGDVMVTAEDINGVALAFQMVGLPSTDIKRMQWFQSQQIEIKKFYTDREADLKRDYLDAKKSGDDTQEIKDDWRQVQEGKAKVRKYFNNVPTEMKARDMSALTDVVNSQHKRELKLQKSIPAAID
jgi:hypothetical protein